MPHDFLLIMNLVCVTCSFVSMLMNAWERNWGGMWGWLSATLGWLVVLLKNLS